MPSPTKYLEAAAGRIRESWDPTARATPRSILEREIAFWSEQLEALRIHQESDDASLASSECDLASDLLQLEDTPCSIHLQQYRQHLKASLAAAQQARRSTKAAYDREISAVHERLLHLLNQLAHLDW